MDNNRMQNVYLCSGLRITYFSDYADMDGKEEYLILDSIAGDPAVPEIPAEIDGKPVADFTPEFLAGLRRMSGVTVSPKSRYFHMREGVLYSRDDTRLLFCPTDRTGLFRVPERVKATPHRAGGADAQSDFSSDCMKMTPLG